MKPAITEKVFMQQVIDLARYSGFLVYHTHDSRRSAPGFPDLVMCHPGRGLLVFAELKSDSGKLRPEQRAWLSALRCAESVHTALWRPSMWSEIESTLRRERGRRGAV